MKSAIEQLTDKQKMFVTEYITDMNATRAAKEAGYGSPNTTAPKLLSNKKVAKAIAEVLQPLIDESLLTAQNILKQLARFLVYNVKELYNKDGTVKNIHDIPEDLAQCIVGFDVDEYYDSESGELTGKKIRVKTVDKTKALNMAMQYRKLLDPAQTNVNINVDAAGFWKEFDKRALSEPPPAIDAKMVGPTQVTDVQSNGKP